ncbi:TPA: hypothetical protein RQK63_004289 [Vibrio vulnificus]|nr:hypothetical protein [Vibrio vulnificus]
MTIQNKDKATAKTVAIAVSYWLSSLVAYYLIYSSFSTFIEQTINTKKLNILSFEYTLAIISILYIIFKGRAFSYRHQKAWVSIFSLPLFSTFSQMLWVGIGIYFSLQSADLLAWWNGSRDVTISLTGLQLALVMLLSSSFIFLESQLSTNAISMNLGKESKRKVEQLEHVIRLAPPGDFSSLFAWYVDTINGWTYNQLPYAQTALDKKVREAGNNPEELKALDKEYRNLIDNQKKHIRAILICYARLAAVFDNTKLGEGSTVYRANIMIKMTKDIVQSDSVVNFLPSIIQNTHTHSVDYYLSLDPDYSVKIYSRSKSIISENGEVKNFDADNVKELILPVFSKETDAVYNCFGAPRAVATGEPQFVIDTHDEIDEWSKLNPGRQVIDAANSYYLDSKKARSILSIPLVLSRVTNKGTSPENIFGSVNIYRNTTKLLSGDESKKEQFVNILTPITQALSRVISLHLRALKSHEQLQSQMKLSKFES